MRAAVPLLRGIADAPGAGRCSERCCVPKVVRASGPAQRAMRQPSLGSRAFRARQADAAG